MRILFIHKNFPAQFGGLATWLARQGWDVTFATQRESAASADYRVVQFQDGRAPTKGVHHYVAGYERAVLTGQGFARTSVALRESGYRPDIIVAHSGWGVGSYAKDIWPDAKFVPYMEWYYNFPVIDSTPHDPERDEIEARAMARTRNAPIWLDMTSADALLCPTRFQAAQFPPAIRRQMTVIHDGISRKSLAQGIDHTALRARLGLPEDARILSYVARGMEPVRGFPEFMRVVARLLPVYKDLHVVVAGQDRVAYGAQPEGQGWKDRLLAELPLDAARIHFPGLLSRGELNSLYAMTSAHLYMTVPFVLSWSLLEAALAGAPVVASDTAPVQEFLTHGQTALLANHNDVELFADHVSACLDDPDAAKARAATAVRGLTPRIDAETVIYPRKRRFFESLAAQPSLLAGQ